jgi:hypothetical protein
VLLQGGERDAEVARDESGAFAFQKREDRVRMLRLIERAVADAERLLRLGEVVAQSVFGDKKQWLFGIA